MTKISTITYISGCRINYSHSVRHRKEQSYGNIIWSTVIKFQQSHLISLWKMKTIRTRCVPLVAVSQQTTQAALMLWSDSRVHAECYGAIVGGTPNVTERYLGARRMLRSDSWGHAECYGAIVRGTPNVTER